MAPSRARSGQRASRQARRRRRLECSRSSRRKELDLNRTKITDAGCAALNSCALPALIPLS